MTRSYRKELWGAAILLIVLCSGSLKTAKVNAASPHRARAFVNATCPGFGWQEGLNRYLKPEFPFPATDTANDTPQTPAADCVFQQWSEEAFVWATALGKDGVPRFMELPTPDQLLPANPQACGTGKLASRKIKLKLAGRSLNPFGTAGFTEGAGAIVQADGNMQVAPNGYPVLASVHMNPSYCKTASQNLVVNGGYNKPGPYFDPGAAVFKATWLRLADGEKPPAGAYTTQAEVPKLMVLRTMTSYTVIPEPNKFETATVALVGLHVVGYTTNHPEFLWATFEHHLNTPRTPDNTFVTTGSDATAYTFYTANTPYTQVNQPNPPLKDQSWIPPQLWFNPQTQLFTPSTNAVLENQTGGASFNFPAGFTGPGDIAAVNQATQQFFTNLGSPQSVFANYDLIGTVWFESGSFTDSNLNVCSTGGNQNNGIASCAIGSVNLANSTAETFEQYPTSSVATNVQNCFMCHNPTTLSPTFQPRRIGISHVIEIGTPYAVPNLLNVPISKSEQKKHQ